MDEGAAKVADTPVRIVCRFANGLMQSSVARGISLVERVLRVSTREPLEVGVQVTVMGAFLTRINPAQITSVKRGKEPGSYIVELTLRTMPTPIAAPIAAKTTDISEGSNAALRQAATSLANRLQTAGWIPYHRAAFERAAAVDRPLYLAATEIAVFSLLAEKGLADLNLLRSRIGKAGVHK